MATDSFIEDDATCSPLPTGGYDDDIFVDPPADTLGLHCPVCLSVLRDPHLLSCCGRHLCEVFNMQCDHTYISIYTFLAGVCRYD